MKLTAAITAFTALGSLSCVGTDVGNPVIDIDFSLYNESFVDPGTGSTAWAAGETIAITEAWISVGRIRLRDAANCNGNAELEVLGPFAVDLLDSAPVETLADLEVPAIGYCRFELRWETMTDAPAAPAPAELDGASIVIKGTRGDGTPFVVRSERNDELRLDAVGGAFTIDDATHALFVGFDGARLFTGVDLDGAVVDNDGVIRIEPGSNDGQLTVFDDNMQDAADLFDDDDRDNQLDPDERDASDVLAD